jgi:hypothetical protein
MQNNIIYLTRMPILHSFKPSRQIELLRTGLYDHHESFLDIPVWEGGDLYPINDSNWDTYYNCIKNNIEFEWESTD